MELKIRWSNTQDRPHFFCNTMATTRNKSNDYASDLYFSFLEEGIRAEATTVRKVTLGSQRDLHQVEVVAPCRLQGDYELTVIVDGKSSRVIVPSRGVREGEIFLATVVNEKESDPQPKVNLAPADNETKSSREGSWRDRWSDCFTYGVCHPLVALSFCCTPLVLGQIMTRMNLNAVAEPGSKKQGGWSTFRTMVAVLVCFIALDHFVSIVAMAMIHRTVLVYAESSVSPSILLLLASRAILRCSFVGYMIFLVARTRAQLRRRYSIAQQCEGEDWLCAFFCHCCTVAQMARHTADYRVQKVSCNDKGVPENGSR